MWTTLIALLFCFAPPPAQTDTYYVTFLRPAPDPKPLPKEEAERIQTAHMANIMSMAEKGILVSAGPFGDAKRTISGIFIMKANSLDEAAALSAQDPTVIEHRNTVDTHSWSGPKGIGAEYARLHKEHPETPENMGQHPLYLIYGKPGSAFRPQPNEKIAAAGPIQSANDDLRAIVIFQRIPLEQAQQIIDADPAIQSGAFRAEPHIWWSADHVLP